MSDDDSDDPTRTKVGRLIEEYDLGEEYGARLESLWLGEETERRSLRDLAAQFNRRLLASAMAEAGTSPIEGEVDNVFRLLTDDDVTAGSRTEARRRLERAGVDVAALEDDFVTYQAIRSYLRDYRGAEYEPATDGDRVERTGESIDRLQSRLASVCESNLDQLRDADHLTLGEFRLFVGVDVLCESCGAQYDVGRLLERGGCDCEGEDRTA